jgi:hypothetical protein
VRAFVQSYLAGIACVLGAALVGLVGVLDHWNKQARMNRAELAEWYCAHLGTRCGGASSARIEAHWNQRELGYEVAIVALGAGGVTFGAATRARTRRR